MTEITLVEQVRKRNSPQSSKRVTHEQIEELCAENVSLRSQLRERDTIEHTLKNVMQDFIMQRDAALAREGKLREALEKLKSSNENCVCNDEPSCRARGFANCSCETAFTLTDSALTASREVAGRK